MGTTFGSNIRLSIFGQSHASAVGVVIDGLPAGETIDLDELQAFLARRAPGQNALTTARKEADVPEILSGLVDGVTCGAPLCAIIRNGDTRSSDYEKLKRIPRPGHADFPAFVKYNGANDIRGGGQFSARLTAPLCIAGGILLQILKRRGIFIGAHIQEIAGIADDMFDLMGYSQSARTDLTDSAFFDRIAAKPFPVLNDERGAAMQEAILAAKKDGDSVGGIVECMITGLPVGLGDPLYGSAEGIISQAVFGIPAVKGIEFGAGFHAARLRGSENNDAYGIRRSAEKAGHESFSAAEAAGQDSFSAAEAAGQDSFSAADGSGLANLSAAECAAEQVYTLTNNHGGILGGLTSGMPVIFRAAFKPTPSIAKPQQSVDLYRLEETELVISGRHDPCVVPRAVPCVIAAAAVAAAELLL